jgi:hypothetical protein
MDTIIEAILQEQIKLITQYKDIDIAKYHRMKGYLEEALEQLGYYQRELGR